MNTDKPSESVSIRAYPWLEKLPSYQVASFWFLRALGLVYLCAFVSLWVQIDGLIGHDGILPIGPLVQQARGHVGFVEFPTLCLFNAGDTFLHVQCAVGTVFSVLLIAGALPALCTSVLWFFYLSLTVAGQLFLGYQWDNLLLETGFLAIWLSPLVVRSRLATDPPPSRLAVLLVQLLLFKLMFLSGFVKLRSQDASWWNLTALTYHFWTQCLPAWPSWYVHKLPLIVLKILCAAMFFIELVLPFFIWGPGRHVRRVTFGGLIGLQAVIMVTGNYTFFNILTCALCLMVLDDRSLKFSPRIAAAPVTPPRACPLRSAVVGAVALPVLIVSLLIFTTSLRWRLPWPRWTVKLYEQLEPFRSVNGYGLFASMTKTRLEIIVEGSEDGVTWRPYEFKWKPGDPARRPGFVAPHQPRLDWQMWFAALSDYQHQPWFLQFLVKLLEGSPDVLALMEKNPFPGKPPLYLRASAYDYHFSSFADRRRDGTWWTREPRGLYCPVISLRKDGS